jgi:hypothetical protein
LQPSSDRLHQPSEFVANPQLASNAKAPPLLYNPEFTTWNQQDVVGYHVDIYRGDSRDDPFCQ